EPVLYAGSRSELGRVALCELHLRRSYELSGEVRQRVPKLTVLSEQGAPSSFGIHLPECIGDFVPFLRIDFFINRSSQAGTGCAGRLLQLIHVDIGLLYVPIGVRGQYW